MPRRGRNVRPARSEHKRVLVVTEGLVTEKQYVERLHQLLRKGAVAVAVKTHGAGDGPHAVVKKCIDLRDAAAKNDKAFDRCVCLVDVDQHSTLSDAIVTASSEGIDLLVTNVKFEAWLLWHAVDIRGAKTGSQLDALMKKHALLSGKHLAPRFPIDGVTQAEAIARAVHPGLCAGLVGPDPSTAMPVLVELLRGE